MKKTVLSLAFVLAAAAVPAGAVVVPETIASWNLSGALGTEAAIGGIDSAYAEAYDLSRGAGLSGTAGANSMNTTGWNGTSSTDYIEFGFDLDAGYELEGLSLWMGTRSSGTGPGTIGIFTSLDNYTNALVSIDQRPGSNFVNAIYDLSSLGTITGDFSVRLMEIGDTQADGVGTTTSGGTFRVTALFEDGSFVSNLQFTGVVIPEPSTYAALFGFATFAFAFARRRLRA